MSLDQEACDSKADQSYGPSDVQKSICKSYHSRMAYLLSSLSSVPNGFTQVQLEYERCRCHNSSCPSATAAIYCLLWYPNLMLIRVQLQLWKECHSPILFQWTVPCSIWNAVGWSQVRSLIKYVSPRNKCVKDTRTEFISYNEISEYLQRKDVVKLSFVALSMCSHWCFSSVSLLRKTYYSVLYTRVGWVRSWKYNFAVKAQSSAFIICSTLGRTQG